MDAMKAVKECPEATDMKGCANLETVCDYMKELGVKYVTVYILFPQRTETFQRWGGRSDETVPKLSEKCIKLADKNKMMSGWSEVSAFDQDIQEKYVWNNILRNMMKSISRLY